jgi:pentatricopeptide repeat protein
LSTRALSSQSSQKLFDNSWTPDHFRAALKNEFSPHLLELYNNARSDPARLAQLDEKDFEILLWILRTPRFKDGGCYIRAVFNDMLQSGFTPSIKARIILIEVLMRSKMADEAVTAYNEHFVAAGFEPTLEAINVLIGCQVKLKNAKEARRLWETILARGWNPNLDTYTNMIEVQLACGDNHEALQYIDGLLEAASASDSNVMESTVRSIISDAIRLQHVEFARTLFGRYSLTRKNPEDLQKFLDVMVEAHLKTGQISIARDIQNAMKAIGCSPSLSIQSKFVSYYIKCGDINAAKAHLDKITQPQLAILLPDSIWRKFLEADLIPDCTLGMCQYWLKKVESGILSPSSSVLRILEKSLIALNAMDELADLRALSSRLKYTPSLAAYHKRLIHSKGQITSMMTIYDELKQSSIKPDHVVYDILLRECIASQSWDKALDILKELTDTSLKRWSLKHAVTCFRRRLECLLQRSDWSNLRDIFSLIDAKFPSLAYTVRLQRLQFYVSSKIARLVSNDQLESSLALYDSLRKESLLPTPIAYQTLVILAAKHQNFEGVLKMLRDAADMKEIAQGDGTSELVSQALVDKLFGRLLQLSAQSGEESDILFKMVQVCDNLPYMPKVDLLNRYIHLLLSKEQMRPAEDVFKAMTAKKGPYSPSAVTIHQFLQYYAKHRGALDDAETWFGKFASLNIAPTAASFRYMIKIASFSPPSISTSHALKWTRMAINMSEKGTLSGPLSEELFAATLKVALRNKDEGTAQWIYETMNAHGIQVGVAIFTTLARNRSFVDGLTTWSAVLHDFESTSSTRIKSASENFTSVRPTLDFLTSQIANSSTVRDHYTAIQAFEAIRQNNVKPDVIAYSALLVCLSRCQKYVEAERYFQQMIDDGLQPGPLAINTMAHVNAIRLGDMKQGDAFIEEMKKAYKFKPDQSTYLSLFKAGVKIGDAHAVNELKEKLLSTKSFQPTIVFFNDCISALVASGNMSEAFFTMTQMLSSYNISPNAFTYQHIVTGYIKHDDVGNALKWWRHLTQGMKIAPNPIVTLNVVEAFCEMGKYGEAETILWGLMSNIEAVHTPKSGKATKRGWVDAIVLNSLMYGYIKNGQMERVPKIFKHLIHHGLEPNESTWGNIYQWLGRTNRSKEAVILWDFRFRSAEFSLPISTEMAAESELFDLPVWKELGLGATGVLPLSASAASVTTATSNRNRTMSTEATPAINDLSKTRQNLPKWLYANPSSSSFVPTISVILDTCGYGGLLSDAKLIWNKLLSAKIPLNANQVTSLVECMCRNGEWEQAYDFVMKSKMCNDRNGDLHDKKDFKSLAVDEKTLITLRGFLVSKANGGERDRVSSMVQAIDSRLDIMKR